ncbi:hypothetical protein AOL_s00110g156 [Orbilia oligospora ATCC 24927]|uniref:Uncharacterized protein n=1 Tax=Arthrobotrys oligospora (strain ATCC 24927 / CBS 115.81 / DSM 1491) TaxID=756982 RepID=G1XKY6_ARTOA|nr:hypothetical protein AOL_s00110g156 [Orbilia oligospora ATCC 24927]EGX46332.1 hypothetical protein AOL_s00110g156 [Orbilia oligospora ATCC 24927]
MAYENADAADMRRYLNSRQERQLLGQSDFHQEHSSPAAKKRALATETSASLERHFARIEIQSTQNPRSENASFHPASEGQAENTALTSRKSNKSESQPAISNRIPRTTENLKNENNESQVPGHFESSEDDDSDLDDEADKISFHKEEVRIILDKEPLDIALLLVHLRCLVETYKVLDDPTVLVLLSGLYLLGTTPSGANMEETGKCLDILSTFKHSNILTPSEVNQELERTQGTQCTLAYLIRAMAYFRLKNYPAAYKDSRRAINLSKKLDMSISKWWGPWKMYNQCAYEIAAASSKLMGNDGNMLYYRSLCKEKESRICLHVSIDYESLELPTVSELGRDIPRIANATQIGEDSGPSNRVSVPEPTQGLPSHIRKRAADQSSNIPRDGESTRKDAINTSQTSDLNTSAQIQGASHGESSAAQVSEGPEVYRLPTPSSQLLDSAITERGNLETNNRPEGLPRSEEELDLSVIIPPSLPNNFRMSWCSPIPAHKSQAAIAHKDTMNCQIFTTFNLNTSLGTRVASVWLDLVNEFDASHIPDALKLTFQSYEDIIWVLDYCIKNNQLEIASSILTKGYHYHRGEWLQVGYDYQLNCLPWVHTNDRKVASVWHFLPALLASEPGIEDSYISECVSLLSLVLGFPLSKSTFESKANLLQETLTISLAVGNTTMASAIARHATHLLTAQPLRTLPILSGKHGYLMSPLPLSVILESKRGYKTKGSFLSLVKRSFWESTELNCKIYGLNLFHTAARHTTFLTSPLLYLLRNHNCRSCFTKIIEDDTPGIYVTAFDIVLSRAVTLRSFGQQQYGILAEIANLFYQFGAAYINDFALRKEDLEILDSTGFPSLFSVKRIPNSIGKSSWAEWENA